MKIVKICGIRSIEAAETAIESGADMLGMILVPGRARTVDSEVALQISNMVQKKRSSNFSISQIVDAAMDKDVHVYQQKLVEGIRASGPFVVGVFRNQNIDTVFETASKLQLDVIQLHGSEDVFEYLEHNEKIGRRFGVIRRFVVPKDIDLVNNLHGKIANNSGNFLVPLLDSEAGGEGKTIDWSCLEEMTSGVVLAGGLNPDNLHLTSEYKSILGYDVSGGVEDSEGNKDLEKIKQFVKNGKSV